MDEEKIKQGIQALEAQGAPQEDIQAWLDSLKGKTEEKPGFVQGLAQDITRPFLKVPASFASAATSLVDPEGGRRAREQGVSFGYLGNVKPFGAYKGDRPTLGDIGRAGADVAGSALEAGSYFMAPLKAGPGLFGAVKAAAPIAATYAAGKGLEAAGEGKGAIESVATAAGNYVGVTAGFGLLRGAGDFVKLWGAKALQSPAVRAAFSEMKNTAEMTFAALPEAFQKGFTSLQDVTNATTRRTVNALRSKFDKDYNTAKDAVIDSLMPEVNTPDLVMGKFQRNLSESMGNMFRETNKLYDDVKADQTKIGSFTVARSALSKAGAPVAPAGGKMTAAEMQAYQTALNSTSDAMREFSETMRNSIGQPLTLKQVMGLWQDSMSYIPRATPEERVVIRDFASGLYADARSVLQKENKGLLNQWDGAYQSWKKAGDVYESSVLNNLKSVGDVDTFVDKMVSKELSRVEQDAFIKAVSDGNTAVQDLFINSVLRKAKDSKPNDGAKLIRTFLDNYGDSLLTPDQAKMLDDVASFMGGSFDEFVLGARQLKGLTDETAGDLLKQQEQLDVSKLVNDTRLSDISNRFTKLKDSPELEQIVSSFSDEEKKVVALSITKDLLNKELPVMTRAADGKFQMEEGYADAVLKVWNEIEGNKTLQKLFDKEQLAAFESAAKSAGQLKDVAFENEAEGLANVLRIAIAAFYAGRGWIPGTISNISKVAKSVNDTAAFRTTLDEMVEQGLIKKNVPYTITDIMKVLSRVSGQATSEAVGNI